MKIVLFVILVLVLETMPKTRNYFHPSQQHEWFTCKQRMATGEHIGAVSEIALDLSPHQVTLDLEVLQFPLR